MQDFAEADRYDALIAIFGAIAFLVDDEPLQRFFMLARPAPRRAVSCSSMFRMG